MWRVFEEYQPQHWFTILLSPKNVHSPSAKETNGTQKTPKINSAQTYMYKQPHHTAFSLKFHHVWLVPLTRPAPKGAKLVRRMEPSTWEQLKHRFDFPWLSVAVARQGKCYLTPPCPTCLWSCTKQRGWLICNSPKGEVEVTALALFSMSLNLHLQHLLCPQNYCPLMQHYPMLICCHIHGSITFPVEKRAPGSTALRNPLLYWCQQRLPLW